jgi:hypothetical protein
MKLDLPASYTRSELNSWINREDPLWSLCTPFEECTDHEMHALGRSLGLNITATTTRADIEAMLEDITRLTAKCGTQPSRCSLGELRLLARSMGADPTVVAGMSRSELEQFILAQTDLRIKCQPLTMCSDSEICQLAELMGVDCAELRGMNRTEQENALKQNVEETTFDNYDALGIFVSRKFDVIKRQQSIVCRYGGYAVQGRAQESDRGVVGSSDRVYKCCELHDGRGDTTRGASDESQPYEDDRNEPRPARFVHRPGASARFQMHARTL